MVLEVQPLLMASTLAMGVRRQSGSSPSSPRSTAFPRDPDDPASDGARSFSSNAVGDMAENLKEHERTWGPESGLISDVAAFRSNEDRK